MSGRVKELDGVRGIAILLVLIFHATYFYSPVQPTSPYDMAFKYACGWGWGGVNLFFVLSGFLITGILLKTKRTPHYLRNFFVRRVLRIFPVYFLYVGAAFFVLPLLVKIPDFAVFQHHQAWFFGYAANIAMTQFQLPMSLFFSHLWSVCVEEQFYMVWPFVVLLVPDKRLRAVAIGMMVFALGYRLVSLPHSVAKLTPACVDALGGGVLLATVTRSSGLLSRSKGYTCLFSGLLFVLFIQLAKIGVVPPNAMHGLPWNAFSQTAVLVASIGLMLLALDPFENSVKSALRSAWLGTFGKYSYGMYIFHFPILFFDLKFAIPLLATFIKAPSAIWLAAIGLNVFETLLVAMASYNLFERHFLNLKEKFAPEPARIPVRTEPQTVNV